MQDIFEILKALRFDCNYQVEGRASIADLFKPLKRCGIYVLHFSTGEFYVGQAIDVTRRYVQHCKNHCDIQRISFKQIKPDHLDEIEQAIIATLEGKGFQLRNIALTSLPKGETDFDLIMPIEQQSKWLSDCTLIDYEGTRPVEPELRRKYQRKYSKFIHQKYATEAIVVLREYVRKGLPALKRGEISFWGCSCLPAYQNPNVRVYSRINIYWQEVFTIYVFEDKLGFSWHLAHSPLEEIFGETLSELEKRYPGIEIIDHIYKPGDADQVNLNVEGEDMALEIISDTDIMKAVRVFNLRQMRKGTCIYNRYHCMDLADKFFEGACA